MCALGGYIMPFWFLGTLSMILLAFVLIEGSFERIRKRQTIETAKRTMHYYINRVNMNEIRRDILRHRRNKSENLSPRSLLLKT